MLDVEEYYKYNLQGKSVQQILSTIRGLKRKMGYLKKIMENPDKGLNLEQVEKELQLNREYFEKAKEALIEAGGTYIPSRAEQRAAAFDDDISLISHMVLYVGSLAGGFDIRSYILDDTGLYLKTTYVTGEGIKQEYVVENTRTKEDFFNEIKALHIGEWPYSHRSVSYDYNFDKIKWYLEIHFRTGKRSVKLNSDNFESYNFHQLLKLYNRGML